MPAALTFYDGHQNCGFGAKRDMYDPKEQYPGYVDQDDLRDRRDVKWVDSVMLPPGYKLYIYEKPKWQGEFEVIDGAYQEGQYEGRLKCQKLSKKGG